MTFYYSKKESMVVPKGAKAHMKKYGYDSSGDWIEIEGNITGWKIADFWGTKRPTTDAQLWVLFDGKYKAKIEASHETLLNLQTDMLTKSNEVIKVDYESYFKASTLFLGFNKSILEVFTDEKAYLKAVEHNKPKPKKKQDPIAMGQVYHGDWASEAVVLKQLWTADIKNRKNKKFWVCYEDGLFTLWSPQKIRSRGRKEDNMEKAETGLAILNNPTELDIFNALYMGDKRDFDWELKEGYSKYHSLSKGAEESLLAFLGRDSENELDPILSSAYTDYPGFAYTEVIVDVKKKTYTIPFKNNTLNKIINTILKKVD